MDGYSDKKFEINKKILLILITILGFLIFAYLSGSIVWMKDILLFVELISSIVAIFIGSLALVRFYTRKSKLTFLVLGIGFLFVGVLEIVQIVSSLNGFQSLISYSPSEFFPLSMVLSKSFLALIFFLSWFVRKDYENKDSGKEKVLILSILFIFITVISIFLLFTNVLSSLSEYVPALIGGILSLLLFIFSIFGYVRNNVWKYEAFEYWLIFSIVFLLISSIFFLPLLNLEYNLMMIFSVFARFLSYIAILIGFLVSIYELYNREFEYMEELKEKNSQLVRAKNSVEEAYMVLRNEKLSLKKKYEDKEISEKI
jgi:hypothetical protein